MSNFVRSTTASGSKVYESGKAVAEYLLFHFGKERNIFPHNGGAPAALQNYPRRLAELCSSIYEKHSAAANNAKHVTRVLDLGCAVGGASFHLSKHFDEVIGLDFSESFIQTAQQLQNNGVINYAVTKQGQITVSLTASLADLFNDYYDKEKKASSSIVNDQVQELEHQQTVALIEHAQKNIKFVVGDACDLKPELGSFDIILAGNLLCRLPSPRQFLRTFPQFLRPNGCLVLVSPYSWLEEYTPLHEWVGGHNTAGSSSASNSSCQLNDVPTSTPVDSFDALCQFVSTTHKGGIQLVEHEEVHFMLREHERKYQYGVSDCTVWKRVE